MPSPFAAPMPRPRAEGVHLELSRVSRAYVGARARGGGWSHRVGVVTTVTMVTGVFGVREVGSRPVEMPLVIGLMVVAIIVAIGAKRARIPYNVALVVGGLLISMGDLLPGVPPLRPEVVFLVCLPALLFEG